MLGEQRTEAERELPGDRTPTLSGPVHLNRGEQRHIWVWHCGVCDWFEEIGTADRSDRVCPACLGSAQEVRDRLAFRAAAGRVVRDARKARRLSLRQCAAEAGCSMTQLSAMEMGRAEPSEAVRELLGLEPCAEEDVGP